MPPIEANDYNCVYKDIPLRDAVLDVVCRTAILTGKMCGDNKPADADNSNEEARDLASDAFELETKYVLALFGPLNTKRKHRLAYHLLDELFLRGNLVYAGTSVNEMLHKLVKVMIARTNKQVEHFTLQMLRAEQMAAFAIVEDESRDVLRAAGLIRRDGKILAPSAEAQAAREQAVMDGSVTDAAALLAAEPADGGDGNAAAAHSMTQSGRKGSSPSRGTPAAAMVLRTAPGGGGDASNTHQENLPSDEASSERAGPSGAGKATKRRSPTRRVVLDGDERCVKGTPAGGASGTEAGM